jgi:hypothetical protein
MNYHISRILDGGEESEALVVMLAGLHADGSGEMRLSRFGAA